MKNTLLQATLVVVISLAATYADASCRAAREAYTAGKMSRHEYKETCKKARDVYHEKVKSAKLDYKAGRISRDQYEKHVDELEREFKANE